MQAAVVNPNYERVEDVPQLFVDAAIRAKASDYDGIQLHAAHGFFLSQYIEYDRGAILGDILKKIRAELGRDFPIIAKINGEDCFAVEVKARVDVPIILVGGFRSIEEMNKTLITTPIEYLSLSRALVREPSLINRWAGGDIRPSACVGCNACYRTPGHRCRFVLMGRD